MKKSTLDENYTPTTSSNTKNEKIKINEKYKGVVTRVESYGAFVTIQSVNKTALAHISECSDKYINDLKKYYTIGDLVKVYVLSIDDLKKNISISLKPMHFENDDDSSSSGDESDDDDSSQASSSAIEGNDDEQHVQFINDSDHDDDDIDLEKLQNEQNVSLPKDEDELEVISVDDDNTISDEEDGNSMSNDNLHDSSLNNESTLPMIDTNFDFEWGIPSKSTKQHNDDASSSSDDSSSDDESNDSNKDGNDKNLPKNAHKSRKNAAKKQRLEKQITMREQALADGTADLNPETISDLERLITSNPNLSQHYIKYMAHYLSCSDIDAARNIARRALNRIDFRKENEKLNVWTALLALEFKFGTPLTFDNTLQDACQRNNPKHVYLRVCEML